MIMTTHIRHSFMILNKLNQTIDPAIDNFVYEAKILTVSPKNWFRIGVFRPSRISVSAS